MIQFKEVTRKTDIFWKGFENWKEIRRVILSINRRRVARFLFPGVKLCQVLCRIQSCWMYVMFQIRSECALCWTFMSFTCQTEVYYLLYMCTLKFVFCDFFANFFGSFIWPARNLTHKINCSFHCTKIYPIAFMCWTPLSPALVASFPHVLESSW